MTEFYGSPRRSGRSSWCRKCHASHVNTKRMERREEWEAAGLTRYGKQRKPRKRSQKALEHSKAQSPSATPKALQKPRKRPKKPRRTRIRAMSREKQTWTTLYHAKCNQDTLFGAVYDLGWDGDKPVVLRRVGSRMGYERHHPCRRWNWAILLYRYCSPELHLWIEAHSAKARELGMLFNLEGGELRNPSKHDPFNVKPEIEELKNHYETTV